MTDQDISLLVSSLRDEYEAHDAAGTEEQSTLVRLVDFVRNRSKSHTPRYSNLVHKLFGYADEYKLKFFSPKSVDADAEIIDERCRDISGYLSEISRNRSPNFMKALLRCMWQYNHELAFFSEPPEPRTNASAQEWVDYAYKMLREMIEETSLAVGDFRINYSKKFSDDQPMAPIAVAYYQFASQDNLDTLNSITSDLEVGGYRISPSILAKSNPMSSAVSMAQTVADAQVFLLFICQLMAIRLRADDSMRQAVQKLVDSSTACVILTAGESRNVIEELRLFSDRAMYAHAEYPRRRTFELISRLAYKKKLGIENSLQQIKIQNRKYDGIVHVAERLNPSLNLEEATELHLFMFDIDGMGRLNRVYGDEVGELICECVLECVQNIASKNGGEAGQSGDDSFFMYFMRSIDSDVAKSVVSEVKNFGWDTICQGLWVTISCGYAMRSVNENEPGIDVSMRAILGLRTAKRGGGDQLAIGPRKLAHSNSNFRELCGRIGS